MGCWTAGSLLGPNTFLFIRRTGLEPVSTGLYFGQVAALQTPVLAAALGLLHFCDCELAHVCVFVAVAVDLAADVVPLLAQGARHPVFTVNIVALRVDLEAVVAILVILEVLAALGAEDDSIPTGQLHLPGIKHHLRLLQPRFVYARTKLIKALGNGSVIRILSWVPVLLELGLIKERGSLSLLLALDVCEQILAKGGRHPRLPVEVPLAQLVQLVQGLPIRVNVEDLLLYVPLLRVVIRQLRDKLLILFIHKFATCRPRFYTNFSSHHLPFGRTCLLTSWGVELLPGFVRFDPPFSLAVAAPSWLLWQAGSDYKLATLIFA